MRLRRSWHLLAVLVLAACSLAKAWAQAPVAPSAPVSAGGQRIYDETRAKLLQVRTLLKEQDSQASVGSGFVVGADGLAITNYHVVSQFALRPDRYRLSYTMAEGRTGSVQLLAIDVVHDLALVRLVPAQGESVTTWPTLAFRPAEQPLSRGERIYSLGNPLDVGFAVVEGNYNGLVERSYLPQIFFSGSLSPGMSGGPALDNAGRVIGINVAARRDGEQVSFLVPAQYAYRLLEGNRSASPVQSAMHDTVTAQLQAHQAGLVERFVAQPWRSANHARYRVPVPQEAFMRCWGSTSPPTEKFLQFERSDCVMDSSVFVNDSLQTGTLSVRHEAYDAQRLGALRFSHMYSQSFANERFASGRAATAPQCKERFVDRDGLALRTVVCLAALKRFPGLYNLSVLTTTVDHATQGVQGRLDARGVDFAGAMKLTEHYLQGFAWTSAAPAVSKAR
jgi:S1-C subfamily serine protease